MYDQLCFTKKNNHLNSQLNYCILVHTSLVAERKDHRYVLMFLKYDEILFSHITGVSVDACLQHNYDHRLH